MPKSPSSTTNRVSLMTVGRMPVIAEDDSLPSVAHPSTAPLPPSPPNRNSKTRTYGRSPVPRAVYPHPSYPPPAYSRSSSRDSSLSTVSTRSLWSGSAGTSVAGSNPGSGTSTPRSSYKSRSRLLPITTPVGPSPDDDKLNEDAKTARRKRWFRTMGVVAFCISLIVGLSVGLTVGMRKQNASSSTPEAPVPTGLFPAGSFAFNTALTNADTNCTSNPSTWRCFPYQTYSETSAAGGSDTNASLAVFFWTVTAKNSYQYEISSSSNPFAPQFTNVTMTLLDGNSYDERLVFNFSLPKMVAASGDISSDDRAATCVFDDTAFRATLWTRRKGNAAIGAADGNATVVTSGSKWADWPGEVEVVQIKTGGPQCKDSDGNAINIAAGRGQCTCRYANFGLEGQ
ncbi:hypothetical protein CSOJ01_11107 [Colletotrichum sojae]|uniref:Tat pathway signal sequence n=1 Tax=Colletotrichum sojae TaxID=2175907 RepID=A0A8H6IZ99_9PEZI|nr:hypothetical protein CSOJ01_11107 [Colletotrichum sojae]